MHNSFLLELIVYKFTKFGVKVKPFSEAISIISIYGLIKCTVTVGVWLVAENQL
jgi:hypothetical protein